MMMMMDQYLYLIVLFWIQNTRQTQQLNQLISNHLYLLQVCFLMSNWGGGACCYQNNSVWIERSISNASDAPSSIIAVTTIPQLLPSSSLHGGRISLQEKVDLFITAFKSHIPYGKVYTYIWRKTSLKN